MTESSARSGGESRPRATSWQRTSLEWVTDEQIDALEPRDLDQLIGLFRQFLEDDNPPTKKMMVSARLKHATSRCVE